MVRGDTAFVWVDIELRWRESDEVAGHNRTGIVCRVEQGKLIEFTVRPDGEALAEEAGVAP